MALRVPPRKPLEFFQRGERRFAHPQGRADVCEVQRQVVIAMFLEQFSRQGNVAHADGEQCPKFPQPRIFRQYPEESVDVASGFLVAPGAAQSVRQLPGDRCRDWILQHGLAVFVDGLVETTHRPQHDGISPPALVAELCHLGVKRFGALEVQIVSMCDEGERRVGLAEIRVQPYRVKQVAPRRFEIRGNLVRRDIRTRRVEVQHRPDGCVRLRPVGLDLDRGVHQFDRDLVVAGFYSPAADPVDVVHTAEKLVHRLRIHRVVAFLG